MDPAAAEVAARMDKQRAGGAWQWHAAWMVNRLLPPFPRVNSTGARQGAHMEPCHCQAWTRSELESVREANDAGFAFSRPSSVSGATTRAGRPSGQASQARPSNPGVS